MRTLLYEGRVREFRQALKAVRTANEQGGTMLGDEVGRHRFQRQLRQAELASLRRQIVGTGGGIA